jgi:serine/threonine-protein kinase
LAPPEDAPAPVRVPPAPAAAREARVEILSDPPAQVYVNGAFVSASPAFVTAPPGRVQVRVSDSVRGLDKAFQLELEPGDNGRKSLVVLQRPVDFRVTPWATVFVDGRKLGDTPFDGPISLYEGKHKIRLVNPDLGVNRTVDFEVGAGPNVLKARLDDG